MRSNADIKQVPVILINTELCLLPRRLIFRSRLYKGLLGIFERLITPHGRDILFRLFALSVCVLGLETAGCEWLHINVSVECPYHVLFDLLFWQVLGSAVDVVILSPRNGHLLKTI